MSKFKRKVQGFITIRSIFCQVASICMVKELNRCYLFTFPFFLSYMERNDGNPSLIEYFLYALNAFVKSCADDCRGQVCRLGETLFPLMLQMWKTAQPVAKVWSLMPKCWIHVCIYANMPKFWFARLDACLKHILCGLGFAQSVSSIRHPGQITLRLNPSTAKCS